MIATMERPPRLPTNRELGIIAELKKTVSASRLNCWQTCRLKFYFRYVLQIKRAQSAAQYVGSMVHLILQAWNLARWRNKPFDLETLKPKFEINWVEGQKQLAIEWDGEEQAEKQTSWRLLEMYFQQTPIPSDEKPEAVEVPVEADLVKHGLPVLIGVIDLVRKGGRIVDFKTTGQTPNPDKASHLNEMQMSCYSVLYREAAGKTESGLELHHLVKLKTPKLVLTSMDPMTQAQETRLFRIMESYVQGLDRQDWIPSPSPMSCSCCEFFNECRRWS
jgi:hypothetical protein